MRMAKFKDFGSPTIEDDAEEVQFSLYGETFNCRRGVPGKVMIDLAVRSGDDSSPASNASVIDDFFKAVLVGEEEYARFDALCKDPDKLIQIDQIMEIVTWLMEMYAERPTSRPEA
jgi:hypothetical protein